MRLPFRNKIFRRKRRIRLLFLTGREMQKKQGCEINQTSLQYLSHKFAFLKLNPIAYHRDKRVLILHMQLVFAAIPVIIEFILAVGKIHQVQAPFAGELLPVPGKLDQKIDPEIVRILLCESILQDPNLVTHFPGQLFVDGKVAHSSYKDQTHVQAQPMLL